LPQVSRNILVACHQNMEKTAKAIIAKPKKEIENPLHIST
jgi:hypothetical protein